MLSASSFYSLREFVNKRSDFIEKFVEDDEYENDTNQDLSDLSKLLDEWNPDTKFEALLELLAMLKKTEYKEPKPENFKAIIFSRFISTCDYLKHRL